MNIFNETIIRTIITIILLFIIYFSLKTILNKILLYQKNKTNVDIKKLNTLRVLFTNLLKYLLIIIGILIVLSAFGFKISSIIAGLGVFSAVLALSLQDSLKDFFAGIFIILENQFSIGDIIEVDNFKGEVTFLGFKSTRIKSYTGEIKIISNRNITSVINYSKTDILALVDINVAYEESTDKVFEVIESLCIRLSKTLKHIKGNVELLGIEALEESSVVYRISVKTNYVNKLKIERLILKEVKDELDKANIKIPYPQLEVHHG